MTKLFTTPPDAEALHKRVCELEAEVERLRKEIDRACSWAPYGSETKKILTAALSARKEG